MEKNEIAEAAFSQLAADYNCKAEDFYKEQVLVTRWKDCPGRRRYQEKPSSFSLATNGTALVIMADERYYGWAKKTFQDLAPQWCFEFPVLASIEKKLNEFGECVADAHEFYLPHGNFPKIRKRTDVETRFYNREDIGVFKGDERFHEAYGFNERYPDVAGVSASLNGKLVGMAGASRDGERLWQIGIDVLEEARGKGLAVYLTSLLKEKVFKMGAVPFYGTAVSHMASQNVAARAGFYPAWAELYSKPGDKKAGDA